MTDFIYNFQKKIFRRLKFVSSKTQFTQRHDNLNSPIHFIGILTIVYYYHYVSKKSLCTVNIYIRISLCSIMLKLMMILAFPTCPTGPVFFGFNRYLDELCTMKTIINEPAQILNHRRISSRFMSYSKRLGE